MSDGGGTGTIRLVSGLPLRHESSFIRQLRLLQRAFAELGVDAAVSGPPFEGLYLPEGGTLGGVAGGLLDAQAPREAPPDRAWILLGYPDQFPFVTRSNRESVPVPTFLWTQLSRAPTRKELAFYRLLRPVALTERTWSFLAAGVNSFPPGGIPIIPHGVDTSVFRPPTDGARRELVMRMKERLGISEGFVVGTVAANTFRKRFDRMFEAYALFRSWMHSPPSKPVRFLVKTDRVRALDGRDLAELAARSGIGDELVFIEEELDEQELAALFGCFDLYLNLSEWEGFCIPVIEAMACGVPVVSHDVQGPGELLPYAEMIVPGSQRNTEEGVTLLDASAEQAAKVIERVYRDPSLLERAAAVGRENAIELYDIRRVARTWLDLIAETGRGD